jgi:hypothetical protein
MCPGAGLCALGFACRRTFQLLCRSLLPPKEVPPRGNRLTLSLHHQSQSTNSSLDTHTLERTHNFDVHVGVKQHILRLEVSVHDFF